MNSKQAVVRQLALLTLRQRLWISTRTLPDIAPVIHRIRNLGGKYLFSAILRRRDVEPLFQLTTVPPYRQALSAAGIYTTHTHRCGTFHSIIGYQCKQYYRLLRTVAHKLATPNFRNRETFNRKLYCRRNHRRSNIRGGTSRKMVSGEQHK